MALRIHLATVIIFITYFVLTGYASPLFGSNNSHSWLDKLPSLEVKVKTDGITVRTGPSREEIYSLAVFIFLGLACLILLTIVAILVYKCCPARGASPNQPVFPEIQNDSLRPSYIALNPAESFHPNPYAIVNSHVLPMRMDTDISTQHSDLRNSKYPNGNCIPTIPYRSTS